MSTISGISSNIAPLIQAAVSIDSQLSDLSRQLGTGQKADTYSGLGPQSGIAVALDAQLAAINSYDNTISMVQTNVNLQQSVLQQIASAAGATQQSLVGQPQFAIDGTGQTATQQTAQDQLGQILDLLNTQGTSGYMFSGTGVNQPSVDTLDHILNGNGAAAGLKQVISERNQADLGTGGTGRLDIPAAAGSTVSVSEDVAGSPYGMKLASVNSQLANAVASGPTGSPPAISVDLSGGQPNDGDTITYTFTLPDGSSQTLTLQATSSATPGANQFSIGATTADTANNLQAALTAGVTKIASTDLPAASTMAASTDFFGDPPMRVAGPPFDTATAQVAGTQANTVFWYTGNDGPGSARSTATARVDANTTVSYGTQANEQGIRWIVQNIAALAATTYSSSDPNAAAEYSALTQSVNSNLAIPNGVQRVSDIEASLASAQTTMQSVQNQHQTTTNTLQNMLQSIEGVDQNTVGAQILSLQTSLSASLSTTARLSQLSLVNYLSPVTG
jgi:flagellar hook-associated protein 3 FlgL